MGIMKALSVLPGSELVKPIIYKGMDAFGYAKQSKSGVFTDYKPQTSGSVRTRVGRNLLQDPPMPGVPDRIPGSGGGIDYPQQQPPNYPAGPEPPNAPYRSGEYFRAGNSDYVYLSEAQREQQRQKARLKRQAEKAAGLVGGLGGAYAVGQFMKDDPSPQPSRQLIQAVKRPRDESEDPMEGRPQRYLKGPRYRSTYVAPAPVRHAKSPKPWKSRRRRPSKFQRRR